MSQSNLTINWENGCQQEVEQEIGVFAGEPRKMVGMPVYFTQTVMEKNQP